MIADAEAVIDTNIRRNRRRNSRAARIKALPKSSRTARHSHAIPVHLDSDMYDAVVRLALASRYSLATAVRLLIRRGL